MKDLHLLYVMMSRTRQWILGWYVL